MRNATRFRSITSFMLRAIFTSKLGLGGLFVAIFGAVWWFLGLWQAFDFLQNNKPVLANLLDSFWGPLLVMVLGFVILYRAVSARWPASQPQETETRLPIAGAVSTQNEAVGKTHRDPRRVEEETDEEFLRRRCRELAQELSGFANRWEKFRDAGTETDIPFGDHRDWPQYTMREYRRHEFDRKLASLLDDLEQLGRLTAEQRKHFNVPTDNPQTIREVAARLMAICNGD